eukprot:TRINITY_DN36594_c0_g1_i1.p1 TRINITY_DN36594_c0_g1~~TRINITY_DN36594_c0_g1_i1.p1  ORF type:complete len:693 (+),score=70.15 TRINITY_DN36594_c0_g1_i1:45-2123(+)
MHSLRYAEGRMGLVMGSGSPLFNSLLVPNLTIKEPIERMREMVKDIKCSARELRSQLVRYQNKSILPNTRLPIIRFALPTSGEVAPEVAFKTGHRSTKYITRMDKVTVSTNDARRISSDKGEAFEYTINNLLKHRTRITDSHLCTLLLRTKHWVSSAHSPEVSKQRLRHLVDLSMRSFTLLSPQKRPMSGPSILISLFAEVPTIEGLEPLFKLILRKQARNFTWRHIDPSTLRSVITNHQMFLMDRQLKGTASQEAINDITASLLRLVHMGARDIKLTGEQLYGLLDFFRQIRPEFTTVEIAKSLLGVITLYIQRGVQLSESLTETAAAALFQHDNNMATNFLEAMHQKGVPTMSGWGMIASLCLRDGKQSTRAFRKYKELGGDPSELNRTIALTLIRTKRSSIKTDLVIPIVSSLPKVPTDKLMRMTDGKINRENKRYLLGELTLHSIYGDAHYCIQVAERLLTCFIGDTHTIKVHLVKALVRTENYQDVLKVFTDERNNGGISSSLLLMTLIFLSRTKPHGTRYIADLWEDVLKDEIDVIKEHPKGPSSLSMIAASLQSMNRTTELNELTKFVKSVKGLTSKLLSGSRSSTDRYRVRNQKPNPISPSSVLVSQILNNKITEATKTIKVLIDQSEDEGWSHAEEPVREAVENLRLQGRDSHGRELWSLFTNHDALPADMKKALRGSVAIRT